MHNYDFSRFASRGAPIASVPPHSIPRLHSASQTAHQRVHRASVGDRSSPAQRLLTCRRARWYCSATFEAMTMIFGFVVDFVSSCIWNCASFSVELA